MRNYITYIFAATLALGGLTACDVVEGPKVDPNGFTGSTNKVLLEDYTGHMCGNCPRAHAEAARLKATYDENVVVVAVHAGGFARIIPALGYNYEFRTVAGTELEAYYRADALTGLPIGVINRRQWNGSALTPYANWGTQVGAVLAESPKMKLDVISAYDATAHTAALDIDIEYFTTGDANHRIFALITEDSIIAQQSDYSLPAQKIVDYVHMHVLRGVVTPGGTWGTPVKGNTIVLGEKFNLSYTIPIDTNWVAKNCHVVVAVANDATKEILQVQEVKLKE
jgi:Outer membrane protein Omp28